MSSSQNQPIRVALIGAGIFARDAHVPSLLRHPDRFEIAAIYSRTYASAATLAEQVPHDADLYTDLDALLARRDIEAVDIVLPIHAQAEMIPAALAAGKHVLSEKPIAPDIKTARQLLATYAPRRESIVWMVGENWRYEDAYMRAAALVQEGAIGTPVTAAWISYTSFSPQSKYYHTTWRRDGSVPGGFLLDGGVHHVAAMRMVLGDIAAVTATTRRVSPDLKPLDTVSATLEFQSGVVGTYLVTYAVSAGWTPGFDIVGTEGSMRVQRRQIEVTRGEDTKQIGVAGYNGVEWELVDFADAIRRGSAHRNTPEEGLRDVGVIEAMLQAAQTGQRIEPAAG